MSGRPVRFVAHTKSEMHHVRVRPPWGAGKPLSALRWRAESDAETDEESADDE